MPTYHYTGADRSGKTYKDFVDAESERAARSKLRKQGIFVNSIREHTASSKQGDTSFIQSLGGRVSPQEFVTLTRQLATLIKANIPVVDCLTALIDQVSSQRLKSVLMDVRRKVNEGTSLADAFAEYPKIFSQIYVNMVRVGEASGTLDVVFLRLAEFNERDYKLRTRIKGAMMYPLIMVAISFLVITVMMAVVIPQITAVFKGMKRELPWMTEILINASNFFRDFWFLLIGGVILGFILVRWYITTPSGKAKWDRLMLKLPVLKHLSLGMAVSRFAQTLSTMLAGGITLLDAISVVKAVVDNEVLRAALENASQEITEGKTIAAPLEKAKVFPPIVIHMIAIGEKTGDLEPMLDIVSQSFESDVDNRIATLTTALEPIMLVVMGVIVFVIVYSIVTPLLEMTNIG